jgi:farnesyl diphosphate synthase
MVPDHETARQPWQLWSGEHQARIEDMLAQVLPAVDTAPSTLRLAMRYAVLGGGKRVRPLLAYAAGEVVGADPFVVDGAAAAVELVHGYSLVHDDLPCMDDDTLRRGKPTCHVAFGEAMALLAGDALQALAFGVLAASGIANAGAACRVLADASGEAGMAGGQAIDLEAVGKALDLAQLQNMHRMKTGALIRAAVSLGSACGRPLAASEAENLDRYARAAGLAFQVVDDVLDVEGSAATLGKTTGKDAASNKPTFVSLLGLAAAKAKAEDLRRDAHAALRPFGAAGTRLAELADWIVLRTH